VPGPGMENACNLCGSKSGRTVDKFQATGLTAEKAGTVLAPAVAQSPLVYECQVVRSGKIEPGKTNEILSGADAEFVRIYFGRILAVTSAPDAAAMLKRVCP
jgi:flavin reductase (DIM6/NTAB) family NADH-FMN oxidoreductase RutF